MFAVRDFLTVDICILAILFSVLVFDNFFLNLHCLTPCKKNRASELYILLILFYFTLLIKLYIAHIPCLLMRPLFKC